MRRRLLIVPALALALVLVGCGSDDDSSDGDDTTTTAAETTTTAEAETGDDTASTAPSETTDPDTEAPDTTLAPDTTIDPSGSSDFCVAYTALEDADDNADIPDDPQSVQDYVDGFEYILPYARDARDAAPDEIADDLTLLVGSIEDFVADLETITSVDDAEARLEQVFDDQELNDAGERVDDYYDATCPQADDDDAQDVPADDPATGQAPETITPPDAED